MQLLRNAIKTWCLIFNELPKRPLILYLGDVPLTYVLEATYLGITFRTDRKSLFERHLALAAVRANKTSWSISSTEGVIKDFHPRIAKVFCTSRLDWVESSGADVIPDVGKGV